MPRGKVLKGGTSFNGESMRGESSHAHESFSNIKFKITLSHLTFFYANRSINAIYVVKYLFGYVGCVRFTVKA